MTASSAKEDDHQQDFISLDDFLSDQWRLPKNQLTRTGRLILMVILANAFLHLQGGPRSIRTRDWSKAKICLSEANDQETPNTAKTKSEDPVKDTPSFVYDVHLAFGPPETGILVAVASTPNSPSTLFPLLSVVSAETTRAIFRTEII